MGDGGAQVLVLRPGGFLEGGSHYVKAGLVQLVGTVDERAVIIDIPLHLG
jgi:hypothetical protein